MLFERNYKTTVKAFVKNEKGEMVEVNVPSYETEKVNAAQFVKGLFTDKAITRNEDGSPKEDHTMRNVLIGSAVIAGGYYYMTHKDENQPTYQSLPEYQQPVYQIPQQPVQQPTYTQPVQQVYQPQPTYEVPTAPVEAQETLTPNEGVTITEF